MKTDDVGGIVKEQTEKKGAIPVALHADSGKLKHSSKYFWDVCTILFSSDEYRLFCGMLYLFALPALCMKIMECPSV